MAPHGGERRREHYVDSIQNAGSGNSVLFNDIGYQSMRNIGIALTARF
ncbi:MAG: hypothetical protein M3N97_05730 [Pseudomonadota bacterium]|nr:hypothetical protein [Pseudomonadota bacterium]